MKRVRITGIVGLADRVRRELATPLSAERLSRLRDAVGRSLRTIDGLLAQAGARVEALPAPSRKAHAFLAGIDFDSIPTQEGARSNDLPLDSVLFRGLRNALEGILEDLAQSPGPAGLQRIQDTIREISENIERQIQAKDMRPEQLKAGARAMRGWLAYFARPENFNRYVAAVGRAKPIFDGLAGRSKRFCSPVLIHFRPTQQLYGVRAYQDGTRLRLPTPMICFNKSQFGALAGLVFGRGRRRQAVTDAMLARPYQAIREEIERLEGLTEHAAGLYHDLAAAFRRVNAACFDGRMQPPRLAWSRTFTFRSFGHYDAAHDTVTVSSSLDRKDVPEYVVDFVVYHELLHKQLGVSWNKGRKAAHTPQFLRQERRFQRYSQAKAVLNRLSRAR